MIVDQGSLPLAVVMISYDEAHNMPSVLENLRGFASEVFLVDSYSVDDTVDIAIANGVHVVQRPFRGFGDQWNFAMSDLPITAPWTMKLDPDERLTPALKRAIACAIERDRSDVFSFPRRLWFMGRPLSVRQDVVRLWRTGTCRFTDSSVNEHPLVEGRHERLAAELEHHDSPTLHHWYEKQNRYSTAEANAAYAGRKLQAQQPDLFGNGLQRRMWLKAVYHHVPLRHMLMWLYCLVWLGAWRGGRAGWIWARMRSEVFRMREIKRLEMTWQGRAYDVPPRVRGAPHPRVPQIDPDS